MDCEDRGKRETLFSTEIKDIVTLTDRALKLVNVEPQNLEL